MKHALSWYTITAERVCALSEAFDALQRLAAVVDASDDEHRCIYSPELKMAKARLSVLDALDYNEDNNRGGK